MKNIVVALAPTTINLKGVVQALKVFMKKNGKVYALSIFGTSEEVNILKDNKDFEVYPCDPKVIRDQAFAKALELKAAIVVLASRHELVKDAATSLKPLDGKKPALGVLIPSKVYNHSVFFLDLGAKGSSTPADLQSDLETGRSFVEKALLLKEPRYGLLYPDELLKGSASEAFDEANHLDPHYQGPLNVDQILEGTTDLVIGEAPILLSAIEGAKGAVNTLYTLENSEIEKSVFFKFGMWWLRDVQKTMGSRFDRSFYGNGLYLLNYPLPIIGLEPTVHYGGVLAALTMAKRLFEENA